MPQDLCPPTEGKQGEFWITHVIFQAVIALLQLIEFVVWVWIRSCLGFQELFIP